MLWPLLASIEPDHVRLPVLAPVNATDQPVSVLPASNPLLAQGLPRRLLWRSRLNRTLRLDCA